MTKELLILNALEFAAIAHEGQKRKFTGEPYIVHPIDVARRVANAQASSTEAIIVALLHDVIEDTKYTYEDISRKFGTKIADYVLEVSKVSSSEMGNRATRKHIDLLHYSRASAVGQTVKLADIQSNTKHIIRDDPNFAKTYLRECMNLAVALDLGDAELRSTVISDLENKMSSLNLIC